MFKFLLNNGYRFVCAPDEPGTGAAGGGVGGTIIDDPGAGAGGAGAGGDGGQGGGDPGAGAGGEGGDDPGKAAAAAAGKEVPELDKDGKPVLDKDGKPVMKKAEGAADDKTIFGEKWREAYLEGETDEAAKAKKLALLQRFASPKALIDKLFEQDKLISSGKFKAAPGKDAKPEEIAAWRKNNGIPEKADGYLETAVPEGLVLGDAEKENMKPFLETMHGMNASPDVVKAVISEYTKLEEAATLKIQANDVQVSKTGREELRKEWGADYDDNIARVMNLMESFPEDVRKSLMSARLGDEAGTPVFANPNVLRAFVDIARQVNPTGQVLSGSGMDKLDSIEDQIKTYEGRMRTDRDAWFKDDKSQQHLRELYTARERLQGKKS